MRRRAGRSQQAKVTGDARKRSESAAIRREEAAARRAHVHAALSARHGAPPGAAQLTAAVEEGVVAAQLAHVLPEHREAVRVAQPLGS
jgi:hypothetical protein